MQKWRNFNKSGPTVVQIMKQRTTSCSDVLKWTERLWATFIHLNDFWTFIADDQNWQEQMLLSGLECFGGKYMPNPSHSFSVRLFSVFSSKISLFTNTESPHYNEKLSIQYLAPGFKLMKSHVNLLTQEWMSSTNFRLSQVRNAEIKYYDWFIRHGTLSTQSECFIST